MLSLVASFGAAASAQSPPSAAAAITQKLDSPQARVYIATLQPHAPSPSPTGHATNRVLVYLDNGTMTRKEGTGAADIITFHRGDVRWRPASGPYVAENTGDAPIRILEIDLKGKPSGVSTATKLDPTVVDPRHYTVALDNDYVRVMRVHFEPHDKGERHEHILNRVVLYVNEQAGAHADDVRISGAGVHAEQNDGDTPADRVAVEIK